MKHETEKQLIMPTSGWMEGARVQHTWLYNKEPVSSIGDTAVISHTLVILSIYHGVII